MTATPLEILHPEGPARSGLALGSAAPPSLTPAAAPGEGAADIIVIAPAPGEAKGTWVTETCTIVMERLSPNGLVYVVAGPRGRRKLARALRRAGLREELTVAHRPRRATPKLVVPFERSPFLFAARETVPTSRSRSLLLRALAPFARALAPVVSSGAVVLRRPDAVPLLAWLGRPEATPVLMLSPDAREFAVALLVGRDGRLEEVIKVAAGPEASRVIAEAEMIARLGDEAAAAGAYVPVPTLVDRNGAAVSRRPAARGVRAEILLRRDPTAAPSAFAHVATWLEQWNRSTAQPRPTADALTAALACIEQLSADLENAGAYRARLELLAAGGEALPFVAVHGDLTAANVYLDGNEISITDWEDADPAGLPLSDLVYWAADLAAARDGYRDRVTAFRDTFFGGGRHALATQSARQAAATMLELPPELQRLAFHATWLAHAVNERNARPAVARPFLSIVRLLETSEDAV